MPSKPRSLWESITAAGPPAGSLYGCGGGVALAGLAHASILGGRLEELRGRSVLLAMTDQLTAALAIAELDGVARRMVLLPPGLAAEHLPAVIAGAAADARVQETGRSSPGREIGIGISVDARASLEPHPVRRASTCETEWILLTSGTTGAPKLVQHDLASLTAALADRRPAPEVVWATFYDIRRYGGLQIYLRALHAGSLVLSDPAEPLIGFLARAAAAGVTHISGTPSHWRRVLMSGAAATIAPRYVRLSGEIADQAILDHLRAVYPNADVAHAFASTEAGVAFDVGDGLAGFPPRLIDEPGAGVEMRVEDGSLRIRSSRTAQRYLGSAAEPLRGGDGFVDTGDMVELRDGRYHFVGRRGGIINIGGLKVHPEEVEAVINRHPSVRMSLVKARKSPITGAIVVADIVVEAASGVPETEGLKNDILDSCRQVLARHKVPTVIRFVPALDISASGKLARPYA